MADVYLSGTSFGGVSVGSVTDVLTEIRDFATANGWTVATGSPSSLPMVLRNDFAVSGVRPFYRFTSPSAGTIEIQMDSDGTGSSLSTAGNNQFTSIGTGSRLWATSRDNKSLVVYVKPSSGAGKAIGFGWLENIPDPNDSYAWVLFNLDTTSTNTSSGNKRVARRYSSTLTFVNLNWSAATLGVFVTQNLFTASATSFSVSSTGGNVILTPIPAIDEGNHFRGFYPIFVNGLCGATAGSISTNSSTGAKYIATGASNHGFRIG